MQTKLIGASSSLMNGKGTLSMIIRLCLCGQRKTAVCQALAKCFMFCSSNITILLWCCFDTWAIPLSNTPKTKKYPLVWLWRRMSRQEVTCAQKELTDSSKALKRRESDDVQGKASVLKKGVNSVKCIERNTVKSMCCIL